jgi:hypothetical protein
VDGADKLDECNIEEEVYAMIFVFNVAESIFIAGDSPGTC